MNQQGTSLVSWSQLETPGINTLGGGLLTSTSPLAPSWNQARFNASLDPTSARDSKIALRNILRSDLSQAQKMAMQEKAVKNLYFYREVPGYQNVIGLPAAGYPTNQYSPFTYNRSMIDLQTTLYASQKTPFPISNFQLLNYHV